MILRVSDMERSLAFYRHTVGLPVLSATPAFSFLDAGSIRLALNTESGVRADETNTEIVLEVADVRNVYEAMTRRGVPFNVELRPVTSQGDRELLAAHFRDADGHLWSVTGWVDSHATDAD